MNLTELEEHAKNPALASTIEPDNDLKNVLVEYVGEKLNPEDQNVTVEMVIDVMANEFPEFVLAMAEENFIRGYEQALNDAEEGFKLRLQEEAPACGKKKKNCKLCEK